MEAVIFILTTIVICIVLIGLIDGYFSKNILIAIVFISIFDIMAIIFTIYGQYTGPAYIKYTIANTNDTIIEKNECVSNPLLVVDMCKTVDKAIADNQTIENVFFNK